MSENDSKADQRVRTRSEGSATSPAADFVGRLVTTIKPRLVVESRCHAGFTLQLAQGLNANGFGKLIVYERDAETAALEKEIVAAGLAQSVSLDIRHESLLESGFNGTIDLLVCSTDHEQVLRSLLPQVSPVGLILLHSTEAKCQPLCQIVSRLEAEGTLSAVTLLGKPDLVMAQKRAGRK